MSKSLSANITAGLAAGSGKTCWLLEVDSGTTTYRWAQRDCNSTAIPTWTGNSFSGSRIAQGGLGRVKHSIDLRAGGNIGQVSTFSFKLVNTDLYSDTLAEEYFENRRAELRLIFLDQTGPSWGNALCVFYGYVEYVEWDDEVILFKCKAGNKKHDIQIPKLLTGDEFAGLPDENNGKAAPIVVGDFVGSLKHKNSIGYFNSSGGSSDKGHPDNFFACRSLLRDDGTGTGRYVVACHDLKEFSALAGGELADWIDNTRAWSLINADNGAPGYSDGLYTLEDCGALPRGSSFDFRLVPELKQQFSMVGGENAVNEDPTDSTTIGAGDYVVYRIPASLLRGMKGKTSVDTIVYAAITKSGITDDLLRVTIQKSSEPIPPGGIIVDVAYGDMTGNTFGLCKITEITSTDGGTTTSDVAGGNNYIDDSTKSWATNEWAGYYVTIRSGEANEQHLLVSSNTATRLTFSSSLVIALKAGSTYSIHSASEWDFSSDDYDEITIKFEQVTVGIEDGGTFSIKNLYVRGESAEAEVRDVVYGTGKGQMYGPWIDDVSHSNSYDEGDLIENAVYFIECLLLDYVGLTVATDTVSAAFDSAAAARDSWKILRDILDRESSLSIIKEIAFEFGLGVFQRYDGKWYVARIDASGGAVTALSTSWYTREEDGTDNFRVRRGELADIKNEFYLRYRVNNATGEPERILFVKNPDAASYDSNYTNLTSEAETYWDLCHDIYDNVQQVNTWEYTAKWIHDDATAELFIKFMVEWLARRQHVASFESWLEPLQLEVMDEKKLTHDQLPAALDNIAKFRLIEQEIDPETDTVINTFLEVA